MATKTFDDINYLSLRDPNGIVKGLLDPNLKVPGVKDVKNI
jgi:hypothetical protein